MEGWEEEGIEEGMEVAVSVSALAMPTLDDKPISKSPDLTSESMFSLLKDSHTHLNQSKDWRNNGYRLPNTRPRLLSLRTKSLTRG